MPKKNQEEPRDELESIEEGSKPERVEEAKPYRTAEKKVHYKPVKWAGVKDVYQCTTCGECRDDVDSIILHVILHAPKAEQESLFNQLIQEK